VSAVAPRLAVEKLQVTYGDSRALFGVSLSIQPGRALAVLGANGAGKSTLAAAVAGVVRAAGGHILIDGRDATTLAPHRRARLGVAYLPEGRGIFPHLSVVDNLRLLVRSAVPRPERSAALGRALHHFPILAQRRHQAAGTLSGGEQQMLGLARVLAAPPRLLVADELSLGLAPLLVDAVFTALGEARAAGVTVLLVEQYVERALDFADEVVLLRHGEVAWSAPAAQARTQLAAGYLGDG
jgi:branched-chain amino acid transport system ATP-binding protein